MAYTLNHPRVVLPGNFDDWSPLDKVRMSAWLRRLDDNPPNVVNPGVIVYSPSFIATTGTMVLRYETFGRIG